MRLPLKPHRQPYAPPERRPLRPDEVLAKALVRAPVPIVWEEDTKVLPKADAVDDAAGGLTAH